MISMDFIRRNMKPIMAALTLMSMIVFVFDDSMRAGSTFVIPLLFALLFGGAGFVWGTRRGKQNEDLTIGAILGLVFGLVLIQFGQRGTEVEEKVAGFSPREVGIFKQQRESANRIVVELFQKSHPIPKEVVERGEFSIRFYQFQMQQSLQRLQFGFNRGDADQEAVFTHLLRQEAKRLGITVSDSAVSDFIKLVTERKLSTQDFTEVCRSLRISDIVLFDILREELEARLAAEMTFPRTAVTPEQRWQDFRKVTVRQQIEATTIPVEAFVAGVAEPTESQLRKFFEEHKEKYPGFKGEPGFRQPPKVRLAYLEADFEKIEAEIEKTKNPTDEEVAKYYEDNKDFYIEKPKPKEPAKTDGDDKTESKEGDAEKKDDKPADDKSEKKPESEAPKPADSEKPKEPSKPEEKNEDKPKTDSSGAAGDDKVTSEKGDTAKKDQEPKPAAEAEKSKDQDKQKPADAKSEENKDSKDSPPKPPADDKGDDSLKLPAAGESPEKRPEPKYQPLEEVKDKILESLLKERTLEAIQKRISDAVGQMRRIGAQTIGDKTAKGYRTPQQVADEVRELAKKLDLAYTETGLLTASELSNLGDTGIGQARDPESGSGQGQLTVIDRVFMAGDENTHTPEIAQDFGTSNQFAYWVVERAKAHVPEFSEPGVKDQVLKAWKLHEASPKAQSRAKDLAKLATEQKSSLKEVLPGQTVLGDKDSQPLTSISPPEFSLFTLDGSAPQLNPLSMQQQRPQLTQISGLTHVDLDVMKGIERIPVGGTDVVQNADRSAYFVVHIAKRDEIASDEDALQRKDFMERWPNGMAAQDLASVTFTPLQQQWVETIERRYNVVWPVK